MIEVKRVYAVMAGGGEAHVIPYVHSVYDTHKEARDNIEGKGAWGSDGYIKEFIEIDGKLYHEYKK